MISAAKRTSKIRAKGFTILEVVIVLALIMLVIGGGIGAMYFNRDEAVLEGAVGEVEVLAKRARTLATLQQRPYALEFTHEGVRLLPYGETVFDADQRAALIDSEQSRETEEVSSEFESNYQPVVRDFWQAEPEMRILVRRWSTGEWQEVKRNDQQVWRFDPQGICEPCGVRIELENGKWIAVLFHPLTAAIAEKESEI